MAYDEKLTERVRLALAPRRNVVEMKMFGGVCFTVDGHMACGIVKDLLMVRLSAQAAAAALTEEHVRPMDFTGKPLKGFLYVEPAGIATAARLKHWVQRAAAHAESLPARQAVKRPQR